MATQRKSWKQRLEVPVPEGAEFKNDRYTNADLIPMPPSRRTWTMRSYAVYWLVAGISIVNYTSGSALIAYGLSGPQAIGCVLLGPFLLGLSCVACGWPGARQHIGFTVSCRFTWGMRGNYFAILLRCAPELIWDGIQAFWGGQATAACLGALSPAFRKWDHTLAGGILKTQDFIGFLVWYCFFLLTMQLPPEKLQKPFMITTVLFSATIIGLLAWSCTLSTGAGPYFASDYTPPSIAAGNIGWAFMFGLNSVLSNFGVATLGQSDWTRFSKGGMASTYAQIFFLPIAVTSASIVGIVVTSQTSLILGKTIWQPYELFSAIQAYYNDAPGARACIFFAGLSAAWGQVNLDIILNALSCAMDLCALAPRYINIKRGCYIIAMTGLCVNPWQLTANATTFITVLGGFGVFYGPMMGINIADYHVVRRRYLKLEDLYKGDSSSIYWYWKGWNLRTFASFGISIVPCFPGFVRGIKPDATVDGLLKISRMSFLLGAVIGFVVHSAICYVFPPPEVGEGSRTHDDNMVLPSAKSLDEDDDVEVVQHTTSGQKDADIDDDKMPAL